MRVNVVKNKERQQEGVLAQEYKSRTAGTSTVSDGLPATDHTGACDIMKVRPENKNRTSFFNGINSKLNQLTIGVGRLWNYCA